MGARCRLRNVSVIAVVLPKRVHVETEALDLFKD